MEVSVEWLVLWLAVWLILGILFGFFISYASAYTYCDFDLKPTLKIDNQTHNLTFLNNGNYKVVINGTTYYFNLECNQDLLRIEPKNLTINFENQTKKEFYLVLIPGKELKNLEISCLNCQNFDFSDKKLNLSDIRTVHFNLTSKNASCGNHDLILLFKNPLMAKTYSLRVQIPAFHEIKLECPNETEQFLNYPLSFDCKVINSGNAKENLTLEYLDIEKTFEILPFSKKSVLIYEELNRTEQLNLNNLTVKLEYLNETLEKNVKIDWKDSSLPRILSIEYPEEIYYNDWVKFKIKAYDDSEIKSLKAYYLNETYDSVKLGETDYEIGLKIKHLGKENVMFEICDPSNCLNKTEEIESKKIKISYENKIILPSLKINKFYEFEILKANRKIENYTVNESLPSGIEFNLRPKSDFDKIYASIIPKNYSNMEKITLNFTFPFYVDKRNVSVEIIFSASDMELELNQTFYVKDIAINCYLKDALNPLNRTKICEYKMSPYTEMEDWIALPSNYYHEIESQTKELADLKNEAFMYKVGLVLSVIALIGAIIYILKEMGVFEQLFT